MQESYFIKHIKDSTLNYNSGKTYKFEWIKDVNMENVNMNQVLEREKDVAQFKEILKNFDTNKTNLNAKKGIYLYGNPGSGKTTFVVNVLKEMDYDIIKYDAGDIRNKSIIDTIAAKMRIDKATLWKSPEQIQAELQQKMAQQQAEQQIEAETEVEKEVAIQGAAPQPAQ